MIEIADGLTDLRDAEALLAVGSVDVSHHRGHAVDRLDHIGHRPARLFDQGATSVDTFDAGRDQALDLLGSVG